MSKLTIPLIGLIPIILSVTSIAPPVARADARAPKIKFDLDQSVFELVVPKQDSPGTPPSTDQTQDKFKALGTAFAVAPNRFVSVAHIFAIHAYSLQGPYFVRSMDGRVAKVNTVLGYSTYRDLIIFDVEKTEIPIVPVTLAKGADVNDAVYSVENTPGQGFTVRGGLLSAYTTEAGTREWKNLKFTNTVTDWNVGGPILNFKGEAVGVVNTNIFGDKSSFALPIKEIAKVSSSQTEIKFQERLVATGGQKAYFKWNHSSPLPMPLIDLKKQESGAYSRAFVEFFKTTAIQDRTSFPNGSEFQEYFRNQKMPGNLSRLAHAEDQGKSVVAWNPTKWQALAPYNGRKVSMATSGHAVYFSLDRSANESLANFLDSPELIMDAFLNLTQEKLKIASLGKASATRIWKDSMSRPWISSVWYMPSDDTAYIANCLTRPRGVACVLAHELIDNSYLDQLVFPDFAPQFNTFYLGTIQEWKDYLALDHKFLPDFIQSITFQVGTSELDLKTSQFRFKRSFDLTKGTPEISIAYGYKPEKTNQLEINHFVYKTPADRSAFQVTLQIEPHPTDTQYAKLWAEINQLKEDEFKIVQREKGKLPTWLLASKPVLDLTGGRGLAASPKKLRRVFVPICKTTEATEGALPDICKSYHSSFFVE